MKILVDTNVIITYLTRRDDKYRDSSIKVMELCAEKTLEGYAAFHSLSIIWYFSGRQKLPEPTRREWMKRVYTILKTVSATHDELAVAVDNAVFKDFEDNMQECCAVSAGCDYIVTVNTKDYEHSRIKAATPSEFVQIVNHL